MIKKQFYKLKSITILIFDGLSNIFVLVGSGISRGGPRGHALFHHQ